MKLKQFERLSTAFLNEELSGFPWDHHQHCYPEALKSIPPALAASFLAAQTIVPLK